MRFFYTLLVLFLTNQLQAQFNFNYNFNSTGRRVCLIQSSTNANTPSVTIEFLDKFSNTSEPYSIKRRGLNGTNSDWVILASNLPPTSVNWTDTTVSLGGVYEYQVRRSTTSGAAIGHLTVGVNYDQTNYKGKMILAVDNSFQTSLAVELLQLKKDLTNEGWNVIELYVPRATTWETEASVVTVKNMIVTAYNSAPSNDKPTHLFLLGHIPIARSGQNAIAPDNHDVNKGARGSDCYYADVDGVFTDTATYNPGGINSMAINLPNDFKWDQDFIPSSLEMAFGRVDFANITSFSISEENLLRSYLTRLHNYRIVTNGLDMGEKTAFRTGYDNSNDGSYRSLIPISGASNVDYYSGSLPFPQWVQNNGPYQIFMQNSLVPNLNDWNTYGMDATIFSSDQSYWGYWEEPEGFTYAKIRALLAANTKCLGAIYTTTAINTFHQPAMGETMGWSCKRIMDHNLTNNLLEKQQQSYDTNEFWNRTHFQYHGDPTLRLFQVKPASNLQASVLGSQITLTWNASTETGIIGYHVYKSSSEFGIYTKLTSTPISVLNYTDSSYNATDWYMVKAIKLQTTGSGTYLNPSIGISNNVASLTTESFDFETITISPNPAKEVLLIHSTENIQSYQIIDLQGKVILEQAFDKNSINISQLENGVYFIKIFSWKKNSIRKFIKN
ncbi:MAG: T9SS type A sorting domain-containing protein [Flavobacterium sp.]